jgi:hypothetical protein
LRIATTISSKVRSGCLATSANSHSTCSSNGDVLPPLSFALAYPVSRQRCNHLTAELALRLKLTPEQCNAVWMTTADAPAQAEIAPENFAQANDIAQIDANNDGTIDRNEFAAACAKGLVRVPARPNR